jgi:hypothetical protein
MGGRIEWDAAACKASNRPKAADFIQMSCRSGWEMRLRLATRHLNLVSGFFLSSPGLLSSMPASD